jgi:hypothetical protein
MKPPILNKSGLTKTINAGVEMSYHEDRFYAAVSVLAKPTRIISQQ